MRVATTGVICNTDSPNTFSPKQHDFQSIRRRFLKCIFFEEKFCISFRILEKFASPADDKLTLTQVKVWCRTGTKPLPERMMTQFIDKCMRHLASMLSRLFHIIIQTIPNHVPRSGLYCTLVSSVAEWRKPSHVRHMCLGTYCANIVLKRTTTWLQNDMGDITCYVT